MKPSGTLHEFRHAPYRKSHPIDHMNTNRTSRNRRNNRYKYSKYRQSGRYTRNSTGSSGTSVRRILSHLPVRVLAIIGILAIALVAFLAIHGLPDSLDSFFGSTTIEQSDGSLEPENLSDASITESIPAYTDSPYVTINGNEPTFDRSEISTKAYEKLGDLDRRGRCTSALACLGEEIMPSESQERGNISEIHPTGWQSVQYKSVNGGSLYNRCHLIGWQLTGNDAVDRNLITGTRYMNEDGMEPFECRVAEYLRRTGNHVMYRVTPVFKGREQLARGVHMEAWSVEDNGAGISFNVYCYNVQPNILIDYKDGDNESTIEGDEITDSSGWNSASQSGSSSAKNKNNSSGSSDSASGSGSSNASGTSGSSGKNSTKSSASSGSSDKNSAGSDSSSDKQSSGKQSSITYVLNTNTMKFHNPSCESVQDMSSRNRKDTTKSRSELISEGYEPCGWCQP